MPLTVVAGLPGSGASEYLYEVAAAASLAGGEAVLAAHSDTARARAAMATMAPVGVRIATLDGIIEALWAVRGDGRRLVRGLARDVLLARALTDAGVAEHPGPGLVSLLRTVCELARGPVPGTGSGAGLPGKLVRAVAAYRDLTQRSGMISRTDVCRVLAESPPPAGTIAIDGFRALHPDHEELLCAWAAAGSDVVIALPWLPGLAGTEADTALVDRLRAAGATVRVLEESGSTRPAELVRARTEIFAGPTPLPGHGAVTLAVAEGREAEARFIARLVADLLSRGAQAETITVAFADPSRHSAWMRRAFDDERVPALFSGRVAVGETPIGSALLGLRACVRAGLPREDLGALMRSPFAGVGGAAADGADLAWRRAGSSGGWALLRRAGALKTLMDEVRELDDRPLTGETAKKWKKLADKLLANAYPGAAPVPGTEGGLDAAAHRAFCRQLQEALELGDGAVGSEEFWELFSQVRVASGAERGTDRVAVTSLDELALEGVDHVIIGGLTASECPQRGSEDRLEGDAVARALVMLGVPVDPEEHLRQERHSFFLAVAAAQESLTLTRCGTDDEGSPQRESVFWDEMLDLYRAPGDEMDPDSLPRVVRAAVDPPAGNGGRRPARGQLHDAAAVADLSLITEVSPSEVETYLSCPYKWFVERRLRAASPDTDIDPAAAGRIAHDTLARFYRDRLEAGEGRVTPASRDDAAVTAERMACEAVAAAGPVQSLEAAMLLRSVVPSVAALVARDASFLPGYAPSQVEWSFGGGSEVPAIDLGGVALKGRADRIDVGPDGLVIVDYKRTTASTLKEIREKPLVQLQLYAAAASRVFGLPVAGGLYRGLRDGNDRGFFRDDIAGAGAFYRADLVDADGVRELVEGAVAAAVTAADEMRAGRIEPTPSSNACRYCSAAAFCPKAAAS